MGIDVGIDLGIGREGKGDVLLSTILAERLAASVGDVADKFSRICLAWTGLDDR